MANRAANTVREAAGGILMSGVEHIAVLDAVRVELGDVSPETELDSLGLDSLDMLDLVRNLESKFAVTVPDEAITHMSTVGDIVASVGSQRS